MLDKNIKNLVFDFDGVIANTNHVKTNAFKEVLNHFSLPHSEKLMKYNKGNGGITALKKFEYYCKYIYESCPQTPENLEKEFRNIVKNSLLDQEYDPYINALAEMKERYTCHIISGGNQSEIINYLQRHGIYSVFDGYILGNPISKDENYQFYCENIDPDQSIYFGDSLLDGKLSYKYRVPFVFISHWSDVSLSELEKTDYESFNDLKSAFEGLRL